MLVKVKTQGRTKRVLHKKLAVIAFTSYRTTRVVSLVKSTAAKEANHFEMPGKITQLKITSSCIAHLFPYLSVLRQKELFREYIPKLAHIKRYNMSKLIWINLYIICFEISTGNSYFESNKIRLFSCAVHLNALNVFTVHLSTFWASWSTH